MEEQCIKCEQWKEWDLIEICIPHTDVHYCKDCWTTLHSERLNPETPKGDTIV